MSEPTQAVFLSYASQDADAARRICVALRAAGVEVWFDQSELVGGDMWNQKIRRQIKYCALLIPIISANTQSRTEGYFQLEWRRAPKHPPPRNPLQLRTNSVTNGPHCLVHGFRFRDVDERPFTVRLRHVADARVVSGAR